jgi:uncharacterized protein YbjT (DUF2867 family)
MITVMGATGKIGGEITRRLLARGERVRALGRSESRLAKLARLGASPQPGDAADAHYLRRAFTGADAVFTMMPYDPATSAYHAQQARIGEAVVAAIRSSGVRHVVALSSVGADVPAGTGFVASLHAQEQRLRVLDEAHVLVLRPGSFFENFHEVLGLILEHGVYADAVDPDARIPMIATRDIASVASEALARRDWQGVAVRELLGPRDLSCAEALRILGEQLERPDLRYLRLPEAELTEMLIGAGFSKDAARLHIEMGRALSEGRIRAREPRHERNTTPTTFEEFAAGLAASDGRE